jgi:hypothetical protein
MDSNAFTLPFTFFRQAPAQVFEELKRAHFTGINLALNYHASRDFLLRQGPQLEYLADGFHYYLPNYDKYKVNSLRPASKDHLLDNKMLESVIVAADKAEMKVNAWAVFLHNSALGILEPSTTVTNALDNHFLSELCPANPRVRGYAVGLTKDLISRGISGLAIESLHFHGTRHGEHHERFFMELSPTTELLFSLCFCQSCIAKFNENGGDGEALKARVSKVLEPFLSNGDPWLDRILSQSYLVEILGEELLKYLSVREDTVTSLYREVTNLTKAAGVKSSYIDQSTIIEMDNAEPLTLSWQIGIDNKAIRQYVDAYLPLFYRKSPAKVAGIAMHYKSGVGGEIDAILRPTYPDCSDEAELLEKVSTLNHMGVNTVDFYLLDTWRPRDLQRVGNALERMA